MGWSCWKCAPIGRNSLLAASSCWRRFWTLCAAENENNMSERLLEMRGISKSYPGVQALDRVHLCADAGEIVCVLGENGAGKSTLVKILAGAERPDLGEILVK